MIYHHFRPGITPGTPPGRALRATAGRDAGGSRGWRGQARTTKVHGGTMVCNHGNIMGIYGDMEVSQVMDN